MTIPPDDFTVDVAAARRFLEHVLHWGDGRWYSIHWETAKGWRSESYRSLDAMVARVERLGRRHEVFVSAAANQGEPPLDASTLIHPSKRRVA